MKMSFSRVSSQTRSLSLDPCLISFSYYLLHVRQHRDRPGQGTGTCPPVILLVYAPSSCSAGDYSLREYTKKSKKFSSTQVRFCIRNF